jgi:DNA-binding LytR/AlgR family response regulator
MINYLLVGNSTDELLLLHDFLQQIPKTQVFITSVEKLKKHLAKAEVTYHVAICPSNQLDDDTTHQLLQFFPQLLIVAACNIVQIGTQQPTKQIFGYLPCPITFERVVALTNNVQKIFGLQEPVMASKRDYVFIKSAYKLIKTNLQDILYIAGMRDYTQVYLKGKTNPITTLQNLKEFETKLPGSEFIRVHRSYIVSLNHVDVITKNEISLGHYSIPIGDSYRAGLDAVIGQTS